MKLSKVYLIGTPIGNLQDITPRAVSTLGQLSHIFAEDTREADKLLLALGISRDGKRLHSFSNHNMKESLDRALQLLASGEDLGLVCDRGMPCLSDPGFLLVGQAREAGHTIIPIPGPSSITTVLAVSGINTDKFVFVGFLPSKISEREALWKQVTPLGVPVCFFESPRRVRATLSELSALFPSGRVFVGREMTKVYETFGWVSLDSTSFDSIPELGEFACVLEPPKVVASAEQQAAQLEAEIALRLASDKDWAKQVSEKSGLSARELYNRLQQAK